MPHSLPVRLPASPSETLLVEIRLPAQEYTPPDLHVRREDWGPALGFLSHWLWEKQAEWKWSLRVATQRRLHYQPPVRRPPEAVHDRLSLAAIAERYL